MHHDDSKAIDRRLARIEGQVRGLRRLIQEGAYCGDILQQINAASSALDQVAAAVASNHIKHCVVGHGSDETHPVAQAMTREEILEELDEVLRRLMR